MSTCTTRGLGDDDVAVVVSGMELAEGAEKVAVLEDVDATVVEGAGEVEADAALDSLNSVGVVRVTEAVSDIFKARM
jgi:hypothetical protein